MSWTATENILSPFSAMRLPRKFLRLYVRNHTAGKASRGSPLAIRACMLPVGRRLGIGEATGTLPRVDTRCPNTYIARIERAGYVEETDDHGRRRCLCRPAQCHRTAAHQPLFKRSRTPAR